MGFLVANRLVENCLREKLRKEGYNLNKPREYGETGTDVIAKKRKENLHIEVIGFKSSGPSRAKDFFQVFFRTISRLDQGASKCIIALPIRSAKGLPARARQYKTAWPRIAKAFPELEIWLVDIDKNGYKRTKWNEWLV